MATDNIIDPVVVPAILVPEGAPPPTSGLIFDPVMIPVVIKRRGGRSQQKPGNQDVPSPV
jgi:hypothetical protein